SVVVWVGAVKMERWWDWDGKTFKEMRGMKEKDKAFEAIFKENENRIHYHLHKLGIKDPYNEFYVEGMYAMWQAYQKFQPDKGTLSTYFNYMIRFRLMDLLRKKARETKNLRSIVQAEKLKEDDGNSMRKSGVPVIDPVGLQGEDGGLEMELNSSLWRGVREKLTEKQWKWVYYYIILEMPGKAIAVKGGVTVGAVKSRGREARKQLRE